MNNTVKNILIIMLDFLWPGLGQIVAKRFGSALLFFLPTVFLFAKPFSLVVSYVLYQITVIILLTYLFYRVFRLFWKGRREIAVIVRGGLSIGLSLFVFYVIDGSIFNVFVGLLYIFWGIPIRMFAVYLNVRRMRQSGQLGLVPAYASLIFLLLLTPYYVGLLEDMMDKKNEGISWMWSNAMHDEIGRFDPYIYEKLDRDAKVHRGEVISWRYSPDESFERVGRVAGLPGDSVSMHSGIIFVNDFMLYETGLKLIPSSYVSSTGDESVNLGNKEYIILGNRRLSTSGHADLIPIWDSQLEGRVVYTFPYFGSVRSISGSDYQLITIPLKSDTIITGDNK